MTTLTQADLTTLTDRELDAVAAEKVMGWRETHWTKKFYEARGCFSISNCGIQWMVGKKPDSPVDTKWEHQIPNYSTDLNAAEKLRQRVAEMGLQEQFAIQIRRLTRDEFFASEINNSDWFIANATARQVTEACIAAVRAKGGG